MLKKLITDLTQKKATLDSYRPLPPALVQNLDNWFKIELTYTSNAIEGNTLTRSETALVVEKGLTIGGKSVKEHLEAINYAIALDYIKDLARKRRVKITLHDILDIHRLILKGIDEPHAGKWRKVAVRIAGSSVQLPPALQVPSLMDEFIHWLHTVKEHPVLVAADAHLKLVTIHPFVDGNGRTARLLLNLLLMQEGYPSALIRTEDRLAYIKSIEKAQLYNQKDDYYTVICAAIDRSLNIYLEAIQGSIL
jgi:Fic family protein